MYYMEEIKNIHVTAELPKLYDIAQSDLAKILKTLRYV